jgi:hypothetical protein
MYLAGHGIGVLLAHLRSAGCIASNSTTSEYNIHSNGQQRVDVVIAVSHMVTVYMRKNPVV